MSEFNINVKYQATKNIKITVTSDTTVEELKKKIDTETKIPFNEIKLIYKGKILKVDSDKMEDLSIVAESGLHMIHNKPQSNEPVAQSNQTPNNNSFGNMSGSGASGLGGLEGMLGGAGANGINPEMMQQMMGNPAVAQMAQQLFSNPEMLQNMINNNPMLSQMVGSNPQLQGMLSNPDLLQHALGSISGQTNHNQSTQPLGQSNQNSQQPPIDLNNILNNPNLAQMASQLGQQPGANAASFNQPNQNYEETFKNQLASLENMGFINKELNIQVLKDCYGNVDAAVEKLLNMTK